MLQLVYYTDIIYGTIDIRNMPSVTTLPPSFRVILTPYCLVSGDDTVYPPAFVRLCAISSSASTLTKIPTLEGLWTTSYNTQEQLSGSISSDQPLSSDVKEEEEEEEEEGKRTQITSSI
jgi:hypothetical protein